MDCLKIIRFWGKILQFFAVNKKKMVVDDRVL